MGPLDIDPHPKLDRPLESGEIREAEFTLDRAGKRRADELFVPIGFGRNEVDRQKLEPHSTTLLVQGVLTPLLEAGIVDSPGLDHASRDARPSLDHPTHPI